MSKVLIFSFVIIGFYVQAQNSFYLKLGKEGFIEYPTDLIELNNGNYVVAYLISDDNYVTKKQKLLTLAPDGESLSDIIINKDDAEISDLMYYNDSLVVGIGNFKRNNTLFLWYLGFDSNLNIIFDKEYATTSDRFLTMRSFIDSKNQINTVISQYPQESIFVKASLTGDTLFTFRRDQSFFNLNFDFFEHNGYYRLFSNYYNGEAIGVQLLDSSFNLIENDTIPFDISNAITGKVIDSNYYYLAGRGSLLLEDWNVVIEKLSFDDSLVSMNVVDSIGVYDMPASYNCLDFHDPNRVFLSTMAPFNTLTIYPNTYNYLYLHLYDSVLNEIWTRKWGGDAYYRSSVMYATKDGGAIIAGSVYDYQQMDRLDDLFIRKVDQEGLVTSSGNNSKNDYKCNVFPNPGNDEFRLTVPEQACPLVLHLYDSQGNLILKQRLISNENCVNTSKFPQGIYLWTILKEGEVKGTGKWVKN